MKEAVTCAEVREDRQGVAESKMESDRGNDEVNVMCLKSGGRRIVCTVGARHWREFHGANDDVVNVTCDSSN